MKAELLAPAGSYESMTAAYKAGADAVYMGGQRFGARAFADNPDEEQLKKAIDYGHILGKKLYLTVNTLVKDREMESLYAYLLPLYREGLDAVIVQDLGVLTMIREAFPDMDIHASTQMNLTGRYGAKLLKDMGATRIVTARELSLSEIRDIKEHVEIEIESFIHGALCFCYSGQCLMSSMIGGRSGNRGRCAQPCRLPYELWKENGQIQKTLGRYLLSPKDICTLSCLPQILESGVYSLKIEGRMKSPAYTAGVTRIYRKYLDLCEAGIPYKVSHEDQNELLDLYNRGGFSHGYYEQHNGPDMMAAERPNHQGRAAAKVVSLQKNQLQLKALESLHKGDILEVTGKKEERISMTLTQDTEKDASFRLPVSGFSTMHRDQVIYRTHNHVLTEKIEADFCRQILSKKINGKLMLSKGKHAILELVCEKIQTTTYGDIPEVAKSRPLFIEDVARQMKKTGKSDFVFDHLEVQMQEDLFLPVQSLKELRRRALEELRQTILDAYVRKNIPYGDKVSGNILSGNGAEHQSLGTEAESQENTSRWHPALTVSLEELSFLEMVCAQKEVDRIYLDCNAFGSAKAFTYEAYKAVDLCHSFGKTCFYSMPAVFREKARGYYEKEEVLHTLRIFDGILLRSVEEYGFLKEKGYAHVLAADAGLYTWNQKSRLIWKELGLAFDTAPLELSYRELSTRGCTGSELVVYGRFPLMVSAQCQEKNSLGCSKKPETRFLRDRKKKYFPVKNHCQFCYNTIYNSVVTQLIDCKEEIKALRPASLRLSFTTEEEKEARQIICQYAQAYKKDGQWEQAKSEFTRGHFGRGVE